MSVVPSRQALNEAEAYYLRTGDELEGFLSEDSLLVLLRATPELFTAYRRDVAGILRSVHAV